MRRNESTQMNKARGAVRSNSIPRPVAKTFGGLGAGGGGGFGRAPGGSAGGGGFPRGYEGGEGASVVAGTCDEAVISGTGTGTGSVRPNIHMPEKPTPALSSSKKFVSTKKTSKGPRKKRGSLWEPLPPLVAT